jgi:hypothetical protein
MDRRSFWTYFSLGSVLGGIALTLFSFWIAPCYLYRNPAYSAYAALRSQCEDWVEKNSVKLDQALIERAVAGVATSTGLSGDAAVIASGLAGLRGRKGNDSSALVALLTRRGNDQFYAAMQKHYDCDNGNCRYLRSLVFLNDPQQTARLLNGDASALTPDLPTEYPPVFASVLDGSKVPVPPETLAKPFWLGEARWLVFSVFCALGFFLCGLAYHHLTYKNSHWMHPFRACPDYLLGWFAITAFLPGYLAIQVLYWSAVIANASLVPIVLKAKSMLFKPRPFDDEYSDVVAQLEALRFRAEKSGSQESLRLIQEALGRVQANRNRAALAQVARSVENLGFTIDGIAELNSA